MIKKPMGNKKMSIYTRKLNKVQEPPWTAENMNRRNGETTFKQCGWCKFVGGGICRYGCYLSTRCSLLKEYGIGNETYWDTPCIVVLMGKEDIQSIVSSKLYDIKSLKEQIKDIKNEIKTLKSLKVKNSPPIPNHRIKDFSNGEVVWIFHENKWNRSIVVSGYRSGDGCVSYVLDDYPESAKGWGCGVCVPGVLKDWEFQYFKSNLEEFKTWLDLCDRKYNGEDLPLDEYYSAMKN